MNMAFSEFEVALHEQTIEECIWAYRRPPADMHDKIRDGQRIEGHTIELFYIRPYY